MESLTRFATRRILGNSLAIGYGSVCAWVLPEGYPVPTAYSGVPQL